jgi:ribosome maturation factor RimP
MIDKEKIHQLIEEHLIDSPLFLVELKVSGRNQIMVFLDGDHGVPISSCVQVSRLIESSLDREAEDFELEVSSVGVDKPLRLPRQYRKNIGRDIIFTDEKDKHVKGKLIAADEESFTVDREMPKKKKKDKTAVAEDPVVKLPYSAVKDVRVQVSFKGIEAIDDNEEEQEL